MPENSELISEFEDQLKELGGELYRGVITQEEYDEKRESYWINIGNEHLTT